MHFAMPPAFQLQVPTSDPSMEMIFDGSHGLVMYMRSPLFDKMVPTGKWVKMDLAKMAKKEGVDLGAIMNVNQADPSQSLRMLMASSDAHVTGSERIRGVQTTHYAFNIDFKKLAHDNKAFKQLTEAMGSVSAPAEAWIDATGPRAAAGSHDVAGRAARDADDDDDDRGPLRLRRAHVNITPPSDDLVVDLSSLTGS